jgi:tetrahydromethanopterin S-methyltransferase subunit G
MTRQQEMDTRMALVEQNYQNLDKRMEKVEIKLDLFHAEIKNSKNSMIKVIIGAAGTITAGLLSTIIVLLMKF